MNSNCITNGNLALNRQARRADLKLVETKRRRSSSLLDELVEYAFGLFYAQAGTEEVASVLAGTRRIAFLANALDRRVGVIASVVGVGALFYLSFFAF